MATTANTAITQASMAILQAMMLPSDDQIVNATVADLGLEDGAQATVSSMLFSTSGATQSSAGQSIVGPREGAVGRNLSPPLLCPMG